MARRKKALSTIGLPERLYNSAPFDTPWTAKEALEVCREAIQIATHGQMTKAQVEDLKLIAAILETAMYELRAQGILEPEAEDDDASA